MKYPIGKRIQDLRKRKGITQEELGRVCNVSTQAVSKWECGGTPDAELLPVIADYFHVSCDYLFARKDTMEMDIHDRILDALINKPTREEQLKLAFELCIAIEMGISRLPNFDVFPNYEDILIEEGKPELYFIVESEDFLGTMRLMKDFHYFAYLPEPKKGFKNVIADEKDFTQFFQLLAKPYHFSVLYYLHSTSRSVSERRIIKDIDLPLDQADDIFKDLKEHQLIECITIDSEEGILKAYQGVCNASFVRFLIFASEFMKETNTYSMAYAIDDRKSPYLSDKKESEVFNIDKSIWK